MKTEIAKHTPGPWKVEAAEFKGDGIVAYEIRMPQAIISKANADLIGAAPDLLFALDRLVQRLKQKKMDDPVMGEILIADVAIAKAEGHQ